MQRALARGHGRHQHGQLCAGVAAEGGSTVFCLDCRDGGGGRQVLVGEVVLRRPAKARTCAHMSRLGGQIPHVFRPRGLAAHCCLAG